MLLLKSLQRISVTLLTRNSSPSLLGLCGLLLLSRFSHVRLCATPWTAAYQAPPSMGFSRQQYWSGVPLPFPLCGLCSAYFWIYHLSHSLVTPFQYFYHSLDKTSLLVLFFPWVFTYTVPFFSFVKLTYHPWTNLHRVHFASALLFYNLLHFP